MSNNPQIQRYRRGDPSPVDAAMVFLRYKSGREVWSTTEQIERVLEQQRVVGARQRKKPGQKEYMRNYFRAYNQKPEQKAYHSAYYKQPKVRAKIREKYATDPNVRAKVKAYGITPQAKAARKRHRAKAIDKIRAYAKATWAKRMSNPVNRIAHNCRSRMRDAVQCQGTRKKSKSKDLLGCTFEFFRGWLEAQFVAGMSWDNYATKWEIDHIKPVCSFSLVDREEQLKAFHYTNCRPLWSELNRAKSGKLIPFTAAA